MRDVSAIDFSPDATPSGDARPPLRFAGLVLDLDASTIARESGEAIPLTRSELALLRLFVSRPGRVLSRDAILNAVSNRPFEPFDRSVDALVGRLRRKIEPDPREPRLIVTVPGEGYRFDGVAKVFQSTRTASEQTARAAGVHQRERAAGHDIALADAVGTGILPEDYNPPRLGLHSIDPCKP